MNTQVKPYSDSQKNKKAQVAAMFNNIASNYDFLNHFLSLNIDKLWRKRLVKLLKKYNPQKALDVATGTGDLAIACLKANPNKVIGIDISEGMLNVGRQKISKLNLNEKISLQLGDAESLNFDENEFDAVTVAFGVRNFENLQLGIDNMFRVLNKGGVLLVLEFTMPQSFPMKQLYNFYFKNILPVFGRLLSKDKSAYTYLYDSVQSFPQYNNFLSCMEKAGFKSCGYKKQSFGIAAIYYGTK